MEAAMSMNLMFLILTPPAVALGLLKYRSDYRRHGRTTVLGVILVLAAWFMPMCVVGYSLPWVFPPETTMQHVGWGIIVLSLVLCVIPLHQFRRGMWIGRNVGGLVTDGVYRYSRNPQFAATALMPFGYALTGWSVMVWVGVAAMWLTIHLTALVEEEHLEWTFGDEYRRYKEGTPRYLLV
jgi:protein-S-isoprenylcysteine O-methyltransferase Ste14